MIGESVFTVGRQVYYWEDVVLAGLVRGDWAALERDLRYGLACLARAGAEHALPRAEELSAAATAFRYERELISAEDASRWLARWRVSPEDWMGYLRRSLLRSRWSEDTAAIADRFPPSDGDIDAARHAEAVCSGTLARLARELAERAACTARVEIASANDGNGDASPDESVHESFVATDELLAFAERLGIARSRSRDRLELLACVEHSYRAFRRRVLSARAVSGEIGAHRLEWIRLACDSLAFDSEPAAREALLCVRADGQSLRDVATAARRTPTTQQLYVDQLPSAIGDRAAGARLGDAFGPVVVDGSFVVFQVIGKIQPVESDPEIVRRAERTLFSRVVQRELASEVRWQSAL